MILAAARRAEIRIEDNKRSFTARMRDSPVRVGPDRMARLSHRRRLRLLRPTEALLLDAATGRPLRAIPFGGRSTAIAAAADGTEARVVLLDPWPSKEEGEQIFHLGENGAVPWPDVEGFEPRGIAVHPQGDRVAVADPGACVRSFPWPGPASRSGPWTFPTIPATGWSRAATRARGRGRSGSDDGPDRGSRGLGP